MTNIKFKEIINLTFFTIIIAIISTLIVDLTVYPISIFAVSMKGTFNSIVKFLFFPGILIYILLYIFYKVYNYRKNEIPGKIILKKILISPVKYFLISISTILLVSAIFGFLYFLFFGNYQLIFKLMN